MKFSHKAVDNTKSERAKLRKSAEDLFSKAIKIRDNYTCRRCGSTYGNMEAAHYITRGNKKIQFHFNNCFTLCSKCHQWAHKEKYVFEAWVKNELGEKLFYELIQLSNAVWKETVEFYQNTIISLKEFIGEL